MEYLPVFLVRETDGMVIKMTISIYGFVVAVTSVDIYYIEQFFDKVNHDKLIQILREQVNDSTTLNLIRKYLGAGVMENGLEKETETGVPQGALCRARHNPPYVELDVMPRYILSA